FSLMPEFTSCKSDRVEATRSQYRFALGLVPPEAEQHPHPALRATFSRREKDQRCPNAFSLREKVPEGWMRVLLCQRRLSFMSWHYLKVGSPRQSAQKSMTEKAAESNPLARNRQHFQGVYFLSH
ncbi:MAG: hypothetical protein WA740_16760, partial [Candidatus Binataceae bacterium]